MHSFAADRARARDYGGHVLDLSSLNLEEIATALADQTDYEDRWLISPETGEVVFWTSDTGIDGQTPVDLDELDLICIDPVPVRSAQGAVPVSPPAVSLDRLPEPGVRLSPHRALHVP